MLSKEDNEFLTRTGPGSPMGDLFRSYWLPVLLSEQLPGPDCRICGCIGQVKIGSPLRVRPASS